MNRPVISPVLVAEVCRNPNVWSRYAAASTRPMGPPTFSVRHVTRLAATRLIAAEPMMKRTARNDTTP